MSMKHTKSALLSLLFCLFSFAAMAQGEGLFFHSLSTEAGLSQTTVQCMFQDSKGFMWFGTQDGLNRYDGYKIKVFRYDENDPASISSNYINSIVEDKHGLIWIATDDGLNYYDYAAGSFTRFLRTGDSLGVKHKKVSALYIDEKDRLWVGTEQGVDLFDYNTQTFKNHDFDRHLFNHRILALTGDGRGNLWIGALGVGVVVFNMEDASYEIFSPDHKENKISDKRVTSILRDSQGNMWIGTKKGLDIYDPREHKFRQFGNDVFPGSHLSNHQIRCLAEDFDDNILIGTNEGYNVFNPKTHEVQIYNQKGSADGNLNHFFIYSLLVDRAGTVWIGSFYGGVNYYSSLTQHFKYYNPASGKDLVYGAVGPLVAEEEGVWAGTGGGGLLYFNRKTKEFTQHLIDEKDGSYFTNQVRAMCTYKGKLLIATNTGRILLYDQRQKKIDRVFNFRASVQSFYEDSRGDVWICINDFNSLRILDGKTGEIRLVTALDKNQREFTFSHPRCVLEDSNGVFWIGTRYAGLFRYDSGAREFTQYSARPGGVGALQNANISELMIDSNNSLWIGTEGSGVARFARDSETFETYGEKDGLLNRNVKGILQDSSGILWISSLSGLSMFDPAKKTFDNFPYGNGFPLNEMSLKSHVKLSNGQFVFGGINGFVFFYPEKISKNQFKPPVIITEFRLFRAKGPDERKTYLTGSEKIKLNHDKSSFVVDYTALNYIFPHNNQYAYKLQGFDREWNYVGDQRVAIYTNLPAGDYTFKVKASNNDGIWNEEGASLSITVLPPFWQTWWAYLIYLLVMSAVFFSFLKYVGLQNKIKLKQMEQQNMENAHQMRIRMFTNFSHELRTPLSLIVGPLEDTLARVDLNQTVRESMQLVYKNTRRLLLLVNQLMDFRKQESGNLPLMAAKGDFIKFSEELTLAFTEMAKKRRINYSFKTENTEIKAWFDRILFEKVYFNLLSNSFKYTPDEGRIDVIVSLLSREDLKTICGGRCQSLAELPGQFVQIVVKDNGTGIPATDSERIFSPFYQAQNNEVSPVGTGIGLSLTRGIVEMHYGKIWVEGQDGEGSLFRVVFPAGPDHLKPEEKVAQHKNSEDIKNYVGDVSILDEEEVIETNHNRNKHSVLIVEDNKDVRNYIKKHLWKTYSVYEASNGEEGVERALQFMPDLVISDVMMPKMDGLQLCRKLKNDIHTSHIPIILLTARFAFQQVKEGFEIGADEYVTKPFSASSLLLKVKALIDNRERLKKLFERKSPVEIISADLPSIDDRFLKKVYEIVDQNISDADFNIEKFSEEIGMSRANLYRKIKALTNQSPNEFIKDLRLRIAIKYLRESSLTISEISYKAGFNSPAYFTNCFKKAYGVSPSEFLENDSHSGLDEKETEDITIDK